VQKTGMQIAEWVHPTYEYSNSTMSMNRRFKFVNFC